MSNDAKYKNIFKDLNLANLAYIKCITDNNDPNELREISLLYENYSIKYILSVIIRKSTEITGLKINNKDSDGNTLETIFYRNFDNILLQFLYFGFSPSLFAYTPIKTPRDIILKHSKLNKRNFINLENRGLYWHYFIWRKKEDNIFIPPEDLYITSNNFLNYPRSNKLDGWSVKQLRAFYDTNILSYLADILEDKINIENNIFREYIDKKTLYTIVKMYFNNEINRNDILKMKKYIQDNNCENIDDVFPKYGLDESIYLRDNSSSTDFALYAFIRHYNNYYCWRKNIQETMWKKLKDSVQQPKNKLRFKWENLCVPDKFGKILDLDELRELAILEGIPEYLFLSKRELCAQLSQMFQNVIDGKKRIENMCINTTSILGENVSDIPPEFFYSYSHNNKIYCDDIRELKKHFQLNGAKHPIDRSIISDKLINRVNNIYNKLQYTTNTMEDLNSEELPEMSKSSIFSSKLTEFGSLLNYPNSLELFKNASEDKTKQFVNKLISENILTNTEKRMLTIHTDLNNYKLHLIEMLILKIKNDPEQFNGLSTIAINTSHVYNSIFSEVDDTDNSENSTNNSRLTPSEPYSYRSSDEYSTEDDTEDDNTSDIRMRMTSSPRSL